MLGVSNQVTSYRVFSDGHPHALRAGNHLFLTAMTGQDVKGEWPTTGDVKGQAEQAFENVALVLQEAGLSWQDVVKVTIYLSHVENGGPVRSILTSHLGEARPPIDLFAVGFPDPETLLTVDVIAAFGRRQTLSPSGLGGVTASAHSAEAIVADGLVHMRGQTARDRTGRMLGAGDVLAQAEIIWGKLRVICEEAGGSLGDLVKLDLHVSHPAYGSAVATYRRDADPSVRPTTATSFVSFPEPDTLLLVAGWAYPSKKETIHATKAWDSTVVGTSQAILLGNGLMPIINISSRNLDGSHRGIGDPRAQFVQSMEYVQEILKAAGATYQNVVRFTSHISHPALAPLAWEVRDHYLGEHRPAVFTIVNQHKRPAIVEKADVWAYLGP